MSQPDSLYELVEAVDHKVDTLDEKVSALDVKIDRRLDELSGQLAEVLRQLGGRWTCGRPAPSGATRGRYLASGACAGGRARAGTVTRTATNVSLTGQFTD